MSERTVNWLVFTCLIGLIPVISRLAVWANSNGGVEAIAVGDLVAFGLVLHAGKIQEVGNMKGQGGRWKSIQNGLSVLFLVFYGLILFTTIASVPNIDGFAIKRSTLLLNLASFAISFSIFVQRRSETTRGGPNE